MDLPTPQRAPERAPDASWRAMSNSMFALAEFAWPIAVALAITPVVVNGLGASAYGVLSLVGVTLGVFGLLDLGIGGAALRAVAQHVEKDDFDAAARVLGTVVTAYLAIGLVGAAAIVIVTPFVVSDLLVIPIELQPAAKLTFAIAAVAFPVSLLVGAFASVAKAAQRFDLSTRVSITFSTIGPAATMALVVAGYGLPAIATVSLAVNVGAVVVYYGVARRLLGFRRLVLGIDVELLRGLARFGGWFITASIGVTILYQFDKILLGSLLSVAAVTYYVVPGSLANRIQGAIGAATQIVFPASAALFAQGRRDALARLYSDGTRLSFLFGAALGIPMAIFADRFLEYWLGGDFADRSSVVMVLLVATYVLLGLTGVAWGIGFGSGRAKVNALFALGMGAMDVVLLFLLVPEFGVTGAAVAYLLSAAIGAPALIWYVEWNVMGLTGRGFLAEYARVVPAAVLAAAAALAARGFAGDLLSTIALMGATSLAVPVLYFALGLATARDRALLGQLTERVGRLLPLKSQ